MSKIEGIIKELNTSDVTFTVPLLSNKKSSVTYRPMKVKDQKALLINTTDATYVEQINSLIDLLNGCIIKSSLKVKDFYIQDFVWLVLNLRTKSLGEAIEVSSVCKHCNVSNPGIKIDFEKNIKTKYLGKIKNHKVKINDDLTIFLTLSKIKNVINKSEKSTDLDILVDEIDYLEYQDEIIDISSEEKEELLDNLDSKYLAKFKKFMETNRFGVELIFDFECKNEECKKSNHVEIKDNILDFF